MFSYSLSVLASATQTPPWQHLKFNSKSDASKIQVQLLTKKGRQTCLSVGVAQSKILGFYPEESPRSQNNAFKKVIARHNQLRQILDFHPKR
jgi:hypothetical protein